jgi:hypothetical protein
MPGGWPGREVPPGERGRGLSRSLVTRRFELGHPHLAASRFFRLESEYKGKESGLPEWKSRRCP